MVISNYYGVLFEVVKHSGLIGDFKDLGNGVVEYTSPRFDVIAGSESTIDSIIMSELKVELLLEDVNVAYINDLAELGLAIIYHDSNKV